MKWFYHAAETEGTAKGGGRVEDIKTPVGQYCLFVCLFVCFHVKALVGSKSHVFVIVVFVGWKMSSMHGCVECECHVDTLM